MHRLTSSLPAYVCHVTRTWSHDTHSTMEESCFQQKFSSEEDDYLFSTPIFNWQEEIQQLVCWPEELDDKWSQKSASFEVPVM